MSGTSPDACPRAQPPKASPPPGPSCPVLSLAQEYRVLTEILLLQVAADRYHIEPEQPFRAWFQAGTWLSEDER